MASYKNGEDFLNKLYKELLFSKEVERTKENKDKPYESIRRYMQRLEKVHASNHKELLHKMYCDKYVIKEENIEVPYNNELARRAKEEVIEGQKKTLKSWLDYLTSEDARYPMWAKYWAFQGMLSIGNYDEATQKYKERDNKTISPFIEANPEVIAKSIEYIKRIVDSEEIPDEILEIVGRKIKFKEVYTKLLKETLKKRNLDSGKEGIWMKYEQGSKEEAKRLYDSLQGYSTGWCTAGSIQTAEDQVCGIRSYKGGDFYVYYTKDENEEYKIPRIAIRMDGKDRIGEIRGVSESQNVEEGFEEIIESKLNDIPNLEEKSKKSALEKVSDSRELTRLNINSRLGYKLTKEEELFLFIKNIKTFGFGYDSRINRLRNHYKINDVEIALEAVKKDGRALEYVSEEVQKQHPEICLSAVKQDCSAFRYVSEEVQKEHPEICIAAVKQKGSALEYVPEDIQKDHPEICLAAVKQNGIALKYVPEDIQKDHPEICLEAVKETGYALEYVSEEIQKEHSQICLAAVEQNGWAIQYVSKSVQKEHPQICLAAVKENYNVLGYVPKEIQKEHPEIYSLSLK